MKKKITFLLVSLLMWVIEIPADEGILLEFRTSYFYPTSSDFRKLFGQGGIDYQVKGTVPLCADSGFDLFGAVDYFSKNGHSKLLNDKIRIRIVPITLGLQYVFPGSESIPFDFYIAGGVKYYFVRTHNNSTYVKRTIHKNGTGGVIETGLLTALCDPLVIDLFASYSFKTFKAPSNSNPAVKTTGLNVGSVEVGAGIGYEF